MPGCTPACHQVGQVPGDLARGDVGAQVAGVRGTGDDDDGEGTPQQPGQSDLRRGHAEALRRPKAFTGRARYDARAPWQGIPAWPGGCGHCRRS